MATTSAKVYQELNIEPLRPQGAQDRIALESFLPYQLSVIASRVSRGLARLYAVRFDLTVPEWRIMTVLGRFPGVSANEVCELTAMDKVRVSRGVARLLQFGRIRRDADPRDRRRSKLYLSDEGREVYDEIVPVAHAYQDKLMADLDSNEVRVLEKLLAKIESGVAAIGSEGFGLATGMDTAAHGTRGGNGNGGRHNGH